MEQPHRDRSRKRRKRTHADRVPRHQRHHRRPHRPARAVWSLRRTHGLVGEDDVGRIAAITGPVRSQGIHRPVHALDDGIEVLDDRRRSPHHPSRVQR